MRRILPAALRALSPAGIERPSVRLSLLALVLFVAPLPLLTGCGLKGDLYLTDESPSAAPAEDDTTDEVDDDGAPGA